ncbi:MAG: hypothetical protein OXU24_09105 [Gammaproteobacteria bacterium]|nr:hypothetical protein [Gammaproteobacteria bacterium]
MNWDALGAIGEIVGAVGVIATLLYLAKQIHESNLASRQAGIQEILNQVQQFMHNLGLSAELTDLWIRGHLNSPDLTTNELVQFRFLLMQNTVIWERTFQLQSDGKFDARIWESMLRHRRNVLASPGYKSFYEARKELFSDEFQTFLEKEINSIKNEWRPVGVDLDQLDEERS